MSHDTRTNTTSTSSTDSDRFVSASALLDLDHPSIDGLVDRRGWRELAPVERIGAVYDFVRDEIEFGYNADDDLSASRVLADGYGQCNTKATLLMALLRASGVACRFHAATVDQQLQAGIIPRLFRRWAPDEILHSWVEVLLEDEWVRLEGVILDAAYLTGLRRHLGRTTGPLLGYAVGTDDLADPVVAWSGRDTEIQMTGVASDHGAFDDPDQWYRQAGTNLSGPRSWMYRFVVRHAMNRRVRKIRHSLAPRAVSAEGGTITPQCHDHPRLADRPEPSGVKNRSATTESQPSRAPS